MRALGLLLVLMTACAAEDALTDSKIAAAKRRWDQSEPSSYEMTLSQTCFCIRPGLVVVTVTNGIVVSAVGGNGGLEIPNDELDRKSTRLNSSHGYISYAVFCLKKKKRLPDAPRLDDRLVGLGS